MTEEEFGALQQLYRFNQTKERVPYDPNKLRLLARLQALDNDPIAVENNLRTTDVLPIPGGTGGEMKLSNPPPNVFDRSQEGYELDERQRHPYGLERWQAAMRRMI